MDLSVENPNFADPEFAGNKAATLARLRAAGFNVPAFFVIPAGHLSKSALDAEFGSALEKAASTICGSYGLLAVRSSSTEEDGASTSFAGQFATYLEVPPPEVFDRALQVLKSADSDHLEVYRKTAASGLTVRPPAVLVQRMIDADTAGVAFAADPVTGDTNRQTIAAVTGTGESLVSGAQQGDTWQVDLDGRICKIELDGVSPVLDAGQVAAVALLVRRVSKHFGKPQDIEWAYCDGELFLLQSRDITTMVANVDAGAVALWDNSNIVESYGGVTLPLTFTVAREAYAEAYRQMGRVLGIRNSVIDENHRAYEQMIGLVQGRVYYNLLNWYRLLLLTPGFRFNKGFMEQMMGVTKALPADAVSEVAGEAESGRGSSRVKAVGDYVRVSVRLITRMLSHNRKVGKFHATMETLLKPVDLEGMTTTELLDHYDDLQSRVIPAWDVPLVNDLFCMIFHGALRKLCDSWLHDDLSGIHNELVTGEAAIISLEPVRKMTQLAELAKADVQFVRMLQNASVPVLATEIPRHSDFAEQLDQYIEKFGDRCLDELKLESETLADCPLPLLRTVGQLAAMNGNQFHSDGCRNDAERQVEIALDSSRVRRKIFAWVLSMARARVRDRENLRFERTRVYGRVRKIFVQIGRRLASKRVINHEHDIFYLDVAEISGFIRGTGVSGSLAELVECRRKEFDRYENSPALPRRFVTNGPPQMNDSIEYLPDEGRPSGDSCQGQACSKGIVRGQVRIVRDPRNTEFRQGEILVAERTDPGWVTIFPLVSGMIMERGSLLSHSAIVARELNIPAVVGVEHACDWFMDGEWVELNGATGVIRKLNSAEKAA